MDGGWWMHGVGFSIDSFKCNCIFVIKFIYVYYIKYILINTIYINIVIRKLVEC
jgi:hypothetical protein